MENGDQQQIDYLNNKVFLNIPEAALFLGVPEGTFRKLVARRYRRIPFTKMGKRIIFKRDLLEAWAENMMLKGLDI